MTTRQENSLSMYLTFRDFLAPYSGITDLLPNYTANLSRFTDLIIRIQSMSEQQKTSRKGVTDRKRQLKESLVAITADYARKLTAFARFRNDLVLIQEVKFSEGKLRLKADTAVRDYAQIVYGRAQTHLADLGDYKINEGSQSALGDMITAYNESIGMPGVCRVEGGKTTKELETLFKTAESVLKNMDAAVEIVRLTENAFFKAYKNARKVIGRGRTTMAVRGLVVDASSGAPMKGAMLSFEPGLLVKKTAEKGGFNIKSLASGMYTVTVQKTGYAEQSATVAVADGELTELHFQLSKN